jgi:hypothetical protein
VRLVRRWRLLSGVPLSTVSSSLVDIYAGLHAHREGYWATEKPGGFMNQLRKLTDQ